MSAAESSSPEPEPDEEKSKARPLDELLAKRSKPFRDWKEEREYLRRKWGDQGQRIHPRPQEEKEEDDADDEESAPSD
ncbi:MAG: hypothetical protein VCA36_12980 [Opitutales bacterium]